MGFFDKMFGRKEGQALSDPKSQEIMKGWTIHEDGERGFRFSHPPEWRIEKTAQGLEMYPPDGPRIPDPALKREAATPRVMVATGDVSGSGENIVKDTLRVRSAELEGYKFVKHHSASLPGAIHAAIYEFQYGPPDNPFHALSAVAQLKKGYFSLTASGTAADFEKYRSILECIVLGVQVM